MSAKPMTKKEWRAFLQKANDTFDWEAARNDEPVIDESAAKRISTALGWEPKREWVSLTDEEVEAYEDWADFQVGCGRQTLFDMIRDIEAILRSKNG